LDEEGERLVPVSLLCRDLTFSDILVGRFLAGLTKPSARRDECAFYLQIMVMSVIGNGQYRENLGFRGMFRESSRFETSLNTRDFQVVADIFSMLEKSYGADGRQFIAYEVRRNRHYLGELAGHDIGLSLAFDAYVKQFGGFMAGELTRFKAEIIAEAERLG